MNKKNFLAGNRGGRVKVDFIFIISIIILWGLGIFSLYTFTQTKALKQMGNQYYFFNRQLMYSLVALVAFLVFTFIPTKVIRKTIFPVAVVTLVLCAITRIPFLHGSAKGAYRWITIGSFSFQPSELAKFVLILYLSHLFVNHEDEYMENWKESTYPLIVLVAFVLSIFIQKDFSTGVLLLIIGIAMFYISGMKLSWVIPVATLAIPASVLMVFTEKFRLNRILAFIFPDRYEHDIGYQSSQALKAISSGGFFGKGMGSDLSIIDSVPEIQSDYIFTGWATSMGFIGVCAYLLVLGIFAWRGFRIALNCKSKFSSFASFGFILMILTQSLMNLAVVCRLCPPTGIPLPFFSAGGTSLIVTLAMCGFVVNASKIDDTSDEVSFTSDSELSFEDTIYDNDFLNNIGDNLENE